MKEISANDNPVIKKFRALSLKKQRDKLGLYIIEGPNLLEEALNCQAKIGQILFDDEALSRSEELAGLAARGKTEVGGLRHLRRGYDDLAGNLRRLGGGIREV